MTLSPLAPVHCRSCATTESTNAGWWQRLTGLALQAVPPPAPPPERPTVDAQLEEDQVGRRAQEVRQTLWRPKPCAPASPCSASSAQALRPSRPLLRLICPSPAPQPAPAPPPLLPLPVCSRCPMPPLLPLPVYSR
eukprot:752227-Prymnesium_polylepis.1